MYNIQQVMNMVRLAKDPQAMLNQMIQTNPQMKQVMDIVNANNGDAKTAFYNLAKQKGVDPNFILSKLR